MGEGSEESHSGKDTERQIPNGQLTLPLPGFLFLHVVLARKNRNDISSHCHEGNVPIGIEKFDQLCAVKFLFSSRRGNSFVVVEEIEEMAEDRSIVCVAGGRSGRSIKKSWRGEETEKDERPRLHFLAQ